MELLNRINSRITREDTRGSGGGNFSRKMMMSKAAIILFIYLYALVTSCSSLTGVTKLNDSSTLTYKVSWSSFAFNQKKSTKWINKKDARIVYRFQSMVSQEPTLVFTHPGLIADNRPFLCLDSGEVYTITLKLKVYGNHPKQFPLIFACGGKDDPNPDTDSVAISACEFITLSETDSIFSFDYEACGKETRLIMGYYSPTTIGSCNDSEYNTKMVMLLQNIYMETVDMYRNALHGNDSNSHYKNDAFDQRNVEVSIDSIYEITLTELCIEKLGHKHPVTLIVMDNLVNPMIKNENIPH